LVRTEAFEDAQDTVDTREIILGLRERLKITEEIHKLLFQEDKLGSESLRIIKFFSAVKRVIIMASGSDKSFNLRVFLGLMHELRMKLEIAKSGHLAEKAMRKVDGGADPSSERAAMRRQQRIERLIMKEFNMINVARIKEAMEQAE